VISEVVSKFESPAHTPTPVRFGLPVLGVLPDTFRIDFDKQPIRSSALLAVHCQANYS